MFGKGRVPKTQERIARTDSLPNPCQRGKVNGFPSGGGRMKFKSKRGFYITNNYRNALLFNAPFDIKDAFWFENPKEISKERFKEYMHDIQTISI